MTVLINFWKKYTIQKSKEDFYCQWNQIFICDNLRYIPHPTIFPGCATLLLLISKQKYQKWLVVTKPMIPKLPSNTSLQSNLKKNLAGRDSNSSYGTQKLQNSSEELPAVGVSEVQIILYYRQHTCNNRKYGLRLHCHCEKMPLFRHICRKGKIFAYCHIVERGGPIPRVSIHIIWAKSEKDIQISSAQNRLAKSTIWTIFWPEKIANFG